MTWQHIPLHCSGITSALKSNIPFATNWGRQRGHLWFIRVHISFICYGRYCPVLRVWGGNSSLSTASPLISIFKVSFPVCSPLLQLHFWSFIFKSLIISSLICGPFFTTGPISPLTEDMSLSLEFDFAITSISSLQAQVSLHSTAASGRLTLRGI